MKIKSFIFLLIFLLGLVSPSSKSLATIPVTSRFISERQSVYISFGHEDISPYSALLAEFRQNIDALEHVFKHLHQEGKLNEKHSILSIEAHVYLDLADPESRFYTPTTFSMKQNCSVGGDSSIIWAPEAMNLGHCYKIVLTVWPITYDNLLTSILLLPKLTTENPRIEIKDLETFEQYKQEVIEQKERFENIILEKDSSWSPDGQFLLWSVWQNQKLSYQIFNLETKEKINLGALEYYLAPPAWSFNSRFIVYGFQERIKIFDLANNRITTIDLTQLFPEFPESYGSIDEMIFAVDPTGNKILFDLSGRWFGADGLGTVYIVWDSETGLLEEHEGDESSLRGKEFEDWINFPKEITWVTPDEELKKLEPYRSRILERYGSLYGGEISPLKDKIAFTISEDNLLRVKVVEIDNFREININQFATVTVDEVPKVPVDEVKVDEKANWLLILLTAVLIITVVLVGLLIYKRPSKVIKKQQN